MAKRSHDNRVQRPGRSQYQSRHRLRNLRIAVFTVYTRNADARETHYLSTREKKNQRVDQEIQILATDAKNHVRNFSSKFRYAQILVKICTQKFVLRNFLSFSAHR